MGESSSAWAGASQQMSVAYLTLPRRKAFSRRVISRLPLRIIFEIQSRENLG